jgi:hypothetical protein
MFIPWVGIYVYYLTFADVIYFVIEFCKIIIPLLYLDFKCMPVIYC